ncbi:P-loop containing nucleoside triphosphate hydrolase [Pseudocohnilembus persalinus]|uniref:Thymidylate kinase n=1 Tax=Pseudocohnilembus persalinus TaxID=266149 RepID=A0A0V0QII4_PSEPJ|nr:P-loop containing nucleoside triphosphate hydrolase [Pseudocohnilembus persalinus]|eukprot:KRX01963.1 P-loop containing nucleoside triphosphate hydrolase [Pseudocohnilembus persalinus]
MMGSRGLLVVFEGLDRCGKSTQCQKLVERLQKDKLETVLQSFPDRTTILGQMINDYLKGNKELNNEVIHLLFSANRWEKNNQMIKNLQNSVNIVLDRYAYSGVAYSSAKGLDVQWCKNSDIGLLKPDIVFYLYLGEEEQIKRGQYGEEVYEKKEFQLKVKEKFEQILREEDNIVMVDASKSVQDISDFIYEQFNIKATQILKDQEIQKLWVDQQKM